jgi:hypothetical protein
MMRTVFNATVTTRTTIRRYCRGVGSGGGPICDKNTIFKYYFSTKMNGAWPVMEPPSESSLVETEEIISVVEDDDDSSSNKNNNRKSVIRSIPAKMNYVTPETILISSRRNLEGTDSTLEGANWDTVECRIHNARGKGFVLNKNGFELVHHDISNISNTNDNDYGDNDNDGNDDIDFFNQDDVVRRYYKSCEDLITETLLKDDDYYDKHTPFRVFAFDHNVRSSNKSDEKSIKNSTGGVVQTPVAVVHGDYTRVSAPQRLKDLSLPPKVNDVLRGRLLGGDNNATLLDPLQVKDALLLEEEEKPSRRYAFINVWRNIRKDEPIKQYPLACVDAMTTTFNEMRLRQIHYADRIGETYFCVHNEKHRWYYFPSMTFNEAMLIKQWDNKGGLARGLNEDTDLATMTLHCSLLDVTARPDDDRESVETRCVVIWDPE